MLHETHWHCINAKVASHVFSLLALVEGTTVCLEIPLQSPPPPPPGDRHLATVSPPPPPPGRPSRANPGVCKGGARYLTPLLIGEDALFPTTRCFGLHIFQVTLFCVGILGCGKMFCIQLSPCYLLLNSVDDKYGLIQTSLFVLPEPWRQVSCYTLLSGFQPSWLLRATPLRRALGIILIANKAGNLLLLDSLLFHTPPLCTMQYVPWVQYVPWGLFFLF